MNVSPTIIPFRSSRRQSDEIANEFRDIGRIGSRDDGDAVWARRLREALERNGRVMTTLALYLASRPDVLSSAARHELRASPQAYRPIPPEPLSRLLRREWADVGCAADVDPVPVWTQPLSQIHRGVLASGRLLRIEVLPVDQVEIARQLEALRVVAPAFKGRLHDAIAARVLQDFCARMQRWVCLSERRAAVSAAARAATLGRPAVVGLPHPELCTNRVFASEIPCEEWPTTASDATPAEADAAASQITRTWIQQALFGSVLPWPDFGEPIQLTAGRIVTHGPVAVLPPAAQGHLLSYLMMSDDAPERAWRVIRPELIPLSHAAPAEDVERAFRCMVPFRDDPFADGAWPSADRIFLQWRCATEYGWLAPPSLVPFYEAFEAIVRTQRDRAAHHDVLADVLHQLRFTVGVLQMQEWMHGADLPAEFEKQMGALVQLPQKVDRLLSVAAVGAGRVSGGAGADSPRPAATSGLVRAGMILAAALVWWSPSTESIRSAIVARPLEATALFLALVLLARALEPRR